MPLCRTLPNLQDMASALSSHPFCPGFGHGRDSATCRQHAGSLTGERGPYGLFGADKEVKFGLSLPPPPETLLWWEPACTVGKVLGEEVLAAWGQAERGAGCCICRAQNDPWSLCLCSHPGDLVELVDCDSLSPLKAAPGPRLRAAL